MGQLFEDVFNKASIYESIFFNVKSVLIHPTLADLEKEHKSLFERWSYLERTKYKLVPQSIEESQKNYEENAVYYPEYSKIVAISHAIVYVEDGTLKRKMKKIVNNDEYLVLASFIDELTHISSEGVKSSPYYFPNLCGHNIISHDIPLLIKRFMVHRDKFEDKQLPLIIKRSLAIKPWESGVIDTVNVWKFNGNENIPLMLIADFLELKKSVDLLPLDVVSKKYWELVETDPEKALAFVSLQSATQTNLVIQLLNELRQI